MRRLLLYVVLLLAACAPTVIAAHAVAPGPSSISPSTDAR
jgi:hypothetical protein